MASIIDATVAGANSNSYVTRAEANAYMLTRLNVSQYTGKPDVDGGDREQALIMATRVLDSLRYMGEKTSAGSALKWPRMNLTDEDGNLLPSDVIPRQVKEATYELALAILASGSTDWLANTGLEGFDSVSVGPLSITINHGQVAAQIPVSINRLLRMWVIGGGSGRIIRG